MKNKLLKLISLFTLGIFIFVACGEDSLVKSEVDSKYEVNNPTISISQPTDLTASSAKFTVTVSDLDPVFEMGILRSSSADFVNPGVIKLDSEGNTSATSTIGLSPLTQYYIKAYALTNSGNVALSDAVSFKTPDAPFIEKISGTYKANMVSYFDADDKYSSTITIKPHNDDGKIIIENLDPFFVSNGFTADKGVNTFVGTYDETASTITIATGQPVGYGDVVLGVPGGGTALVLTVKNNGATLSVGDTMWGMLSAAGWYELYLGKYDYTKQ